MSHLPSKRKKKKKSLHHILAHGGNLKFHIAAQKLSNSKKNFVLDKD